MSTRPGEGEQPKPKRRRRWKWIGGGALALFVGFVVCVFMPEKAFDEPVYQGKPLSKWLDGYALWRGIEPTDEQDGKVDAVVRKIGTNSIPALFHWLELRDTTTHKLKFWIAKKGWYEFKEWPLPAEARNMQAANGFHALGPEAREAVPRLIKLYERNRSVLDRELVAHALGGIGPAASNAVPVLLGVITNFTGQGTIHNSFAALGEIHVFPEKIVPFLIPYLTNSEGSFRNSAIWNLRQYGSNARPAIPALLERLHDEESYIRTNAARALKVIDPEAAAKAGIK